MEECQRRVGRVGPEHQSSRCGRGEQRRPLRRRVSSAECFFLRRNRGELGVRTRLGTRSTRSGQAQARDTSALLSCVHTHMETSYASPRRSLLSEGHSVVLAAEPYSVPGTGVVHELVLLRTDISPSEVRPPLHSEVGPELG